MRSRAAHSRPAGRSSRGLSPSHRQGRRTAAVSERRKRPRGKAACRKCGRCCREKVDIEGVVFYTDRVCKFWDARTKLCTVYERRKVACRDCGNLEAAIRGGELPGDCPFVRGVKGYVPPLESWEDPEVEAILASLPVDQNTVYCPRKRR